MDSFKLKLKALPFGNQTFNYLLNGDFFPENEPAEVRAAHVQVELNITRKSETVFLLDIRCHGTLTIDCSRCLDDMRHDVDTVYSLSLKFEGDRLDDSRDGVLLVPESWQELDVEPLVRDTVLLTIPITHTHEDGQCNQEMTELILDHLSESQGQTETTDKQTADAEIDPRWEALRKLKDNN